MSQIHVCYMKHACCLEYQHAPAIKCNDPDFSLTKAMLHRIQQSVLPSIPSVKCVVGGLGDLPAFERHRIRRAL